MIPAHAWESGTGGLGGRGTLPKSPGGLKARVGWKKSFEKNARRGDIHIHIHTHIHPLQLIEQIGPGADELKKRKTQHVDKIGLENTGTQQKLFVASLRLCSLVYVSALY